MRIKDEMRRIVNLLAKQYPDKYIHISLSSRFWPRDGGNARMDWEHGLYIEDTITPAEKFNSIKEMKTYIKAKQIDAEGE